MPRLIVLPDSAKPRSSDSITSWTPGGPVSNTVTNNYHVAGGYTSSNNISTSENINCARSGNMYTSSGIKVNVNSSNTQDYFSQHWIGPNGVSTWNGSVILGSGLVGSSVSNPSGHWTKKVKGFYCEINGQPDGAGTSAGDGCGVVQYVRVSGVFLDSNGRIRIYDMCQGGGKILGHTWNDTVPTSNTWTQMSYYVNSNNQLDMYHMAWILNVKHKKVCGGGSVNKNMTLKVRYMTPLVSESGGLFFDNKNRFQMLNALRSWSNRSSLPLYTV